MHDASAKLPSGIFNGNVNQYGDYDQCLNVVAGSSKFRGKYCIAYIQPRSRNGTMKDLLQLVQSHEFFKSSFDDVSDVCFFCFICHFQFYIYLIKNLHSVDIERRASVISTGQFACHRHAVIAIWNMESDII